MRALEAKELFRCITAEYFANATVVDNRQRGDVKSPLGLVSLAAGAVKRPYLPCYSQIDGTLVGHYESRMSITVDLFTHGLAVEYGGQVIGYDNSAVDDLLAFADYLNSPFVTDWCRENDMTILIDGDVQDVSGFLNDAAYEYRARMTVMLYFTQVVVGRAGILSESSIRYPVYATDPVTGEFMRDEHGHPVITTDETGKPVYTTTPPAAAVSASNGELTQAREIENGAIVDPVFRQTSTGGGTPELASLQDGYATQIELEEVNFE